MVRAPKALGASEGSPARPLLAFPPYLRHITNLSYTHGTTQTQQKQAKVLHMRHARPASQTPNYPTQCRHPRIFSHTKQTAFLAFARSSGCLATVRRQPWILEGDQSTPFRIPAEATLARKSDNHSGHTGYLPSELWHLVHHG